MLLEEPIAFLKFLNIILFGSVFCFYILSSIISYWFRKKRKLKVNKSFRYDNGKPTLEFRVPLYYSTPMEDEVWSTFEQDQLFTYKNNDYIIAQIVEEQNKKTIANCIVFAFICKKIVVSLVPKHQLSKAEVQNGDRYITHGDGSPIIKDSKNVTINNNALNSLKELNDFFLNANLQDVPDKSFILECISLIKNNHNLGDKKTDFIITLGNYAKTVPAIATAIASVISLLTN
ncbi:hypothetical protein [Culicoidibacter larvae]|uniref:Uncharacterized protein n=1 Tax=Culicoidibacter larvae TaxID=2579976 RepID=A0A5R8QI04_9FIRM|nr:hypothetical protein [Culicoidibacter larvae]TLG77356.1 hypothetical protein FEZ08_01685 [Culicoidibacter larvae]